MGASHARPIRRHFVRGLDRRVRRGGPKVAVGFNPRSAITPNNLVAERLLCVAGRARSGSRTSDRDSSEAAPQTEVGCSVFRNWRASNLINELRFLPANFEKPNTRPLARKTSLIHNNFRSQRSLAPTARP